MQVRKQRGASLVEILVVIVVFLVGILAMLQVFPGGLSILRTTKNNTIAAELARAEIERLKGLADQMPEAILPVQYELIGGSIVVLPDATRTERNLMPRGNEIDQGGQLLEGNLNRGDWSRSSGANVWSRVIGEGRTVPTPRFVGNEFGGLLSLQFAPITYDRDANSGIGVPGGLDLYGNALVRRGGNRRRGQPDPYNDVREWRYFFVEDDETAQGEPFEREDQLWLPANAVDGKRIAYRIDLSFAIARDGNTLQANGIFRAVLDPGSAPSYARLLGRYWVVSIQKLISQPDSFGRVLYEEADYLGIDPDALRVNRLFEELPLNQAFSRDPWEYKVLSAGLGFVLINPSAFGVNIATFRGSEPLVARADYTVLDWRIIRDDFRVPDTGVPQIQTALRSLKVKRRPGPDGIPYQGLGLQLPAQFGDFDNDGASDGDQTDVMVLDTESGGVFIGNFDGAMSRNDPAREFESFVVDKSGGLITFKDVDNDSRNGLSGYVVLPDRNEPDGWSRTPTLIPDIRRRALRALYQARQEWSPHVFMASRRYNISYIGNRDQLQSGEAYIGNSNPTFGGEPTRIYFAPSEVGKKVVIGEIWYLDGTNRVQSLFDQEFQIVNEPGNRFALPFIDITSKAPDATGFDYSNGYAVRRISGASVSVRVLWNPESFILGPDGAENFRSLERWSRAWRRISVETFLLGGQTNP